MISKKRLKYWSGISKLTGKTVTSIVASSATMSEMMERLIIMIHSFFSGFHSSVVDAFSISIKVVADEETVSVGASAPFDEFKVDREVFEGSFAPGEEKRSAVVSIGETGLGSEKDNFGVAFAEMGNSSPPIRGVVPVIAAGITVIVPLYNEDLV